CGLLRRHLHPVPQARPEPEPGRRRPARPESGSAGMSAIQDRSWTGRMRRRAVGALPPEKLLPDQQPSYVASWIYIFGVLSLSSLAVVIGSGTILALKGPGWWHFTGVGLFFNS